MENGLRLTLDLHSNTVSFGTLDQAYNGFKVLIGGPSEFPMMRKKSIKLQAGKEQDGMNNIPMTLELSASHHIVTTLHTIKDCDGQKAARAAIFLDFPRVFLNCFEFYFYSRWSGPILLFWFL